MSYKDADRQREYERNWVAARRANWIASQGGCCAKCGSTDRLEVDHIDPATKTCNPTRIWSREQAFRDMELAKCQVLCYECHKEKTFAAVVVVHGIRYTYRARGCRCEECREWNRQRVRAQRQAVAA